MAGPIFVDVADAAEGADLARSLGRHGLTAALVHGDARWQVEISSPREDVRAFLADVGVALAIHEVAVAARGRARAGKSSARRDTNGRTDGRPAHARAGEGGAR